MLLFIMFSTLFLIGCSTDNDNPLDDAPPTENNNSKDEGNDDSQKPAEDVRYYVKYEVYMPLGYDRKGLKDISFITEYGEENITTSNAEWEGTYGPFKKGSRLYIKVVAKGAIRNDSEYYVRLFVSRNEEPFVIKGEQKGEKLSTLSALYTIDF